MKRRHLAPALLLLLPLAAWAAQPLPARNLWVELRWVESQMSAAALAGVRDGAVVVGTAGAVSPRGQVVMGSTQRDTTIQSLPRLLVLNGRSASVQLAESAPVQWLDYGIEAEAGTRGAPASSAKVYAVPRSSVQTTRSRGFSVSPRWAGGQQPVLVELRGQLSQPADEGGGATQQTELLSTVQLPLGQWLTIARSGAGLQAQQRGTLSTRDAEPSVLRELQLRVDLAP